MENGEKESLATSGKADGMSLDRSLAMSWAKEDFRSTKRALGKKARPKIDTMNSNVVEAENIMKEAKKSISAEKFEEALLLFPKALDLYDQVKKQELPDGALFNLYFSWAFTLQEKGKREYLQMEGQDPERVDEVDKWFIEAIEKLKLALKQSSKNPLAMHSMACAFICRGDLREGVPADKLYAKACKKLKVAIDANDSEENPVPAALWRTWGNAALKRAQLRKVKLDEREELFNEASKKYLSALRADPDDSITTHTYALFMHFKASDVLAQAVRQREVPEKLKLLMTVRDYLQTAFHYKHDCTPALALWASYLEVHLEYITPERQVQMDREMKETRKIVDWLNLRQLLDQRTDNIIYFGYGTKQGGNRPNWKRRFFVLTPGKLFYYTDAGGKLKGSISLNQVSSVTISKEILMPRPAPTKPRSDRGSISAASGSAIIPPPSSDGIQGWDEDGYGFHIITPTRIYNVVVDHVKQRDKWTDAIYQAISVIPSRPSGSAIDFNALAAKKPRKGVLSSLRRG